MDVHCKCGELTHVDSDFIYNVKCSKCGTVYHLNPNIELIEIQKYGDDLSMGVSE